MPDFDYKLTKIHRHLLQLLITHPFFEQQNLHNVFNDIVRSHRDALSATSDRTLDDFINSLNDNLSTVSMKISLYVFQKTEQWYYSIANEVGDDDLAKFATTFSTQEILYFKVLLAKIAELDGEGNQLTLMDAVIMRPKELKLEDADKCINSLIQQGWLWEHKEDGARRLWFGIRTCMDLRQYLDQELGVMLQ